MGTLVSKMPSFFPISSFKDFWWERNSSNVSKLLFLFPLIKSSKKAQVQCFPNNTSLQKDISVCCFSISIWILLAPVNCMLWGIILELELSVGLFCSCLPADKKKNIPRAQMISFSSQINVRCLSFKSRSRKARIYHLDLRKCLAFRLSSKAP